MGNVQVSYKAVSWRTSKVLQKFEQNCISLIRSREGSWRLTDKPLSLQEGPSPAVSDSSSIPPTIYILTTESFQTKDFNRTGGQQEAQGKPNGPQDFSYKCRASGAWVCNKYAGYGSRQGPRNLLHNIHLPRITWSRKEATAVSACLLPVSFGKSFFLFLLTFCPRKKAVTSLKSSEFISGSSSCKITSLLISVLI